MNYYDGISKGYDELYGQEQLLKWSKVKEIITFSREDTILDIGCGTGILTETIPLHPYIKDHLAIYI